MMEAQCTRLSMCISKVWFNCRKAVLCLDPTQNVLHLFSLVLAAASLQTPEISLSTTQLGVADLGQRIDLMCSLNSSDVQPYNTLQWLDGEMPIESSASREIIRCGNSITLRFHNFSTLDFGVYKCRCVNEDYENGMEQFCSQPSSITRLPEGRIALQ